MTLKNADSITQPYVLCTDRPAQLRGDGWCCFMNIKFAWVAHVTRIQNTTRGLVYTHQPREEEEEEEEALSSVCKENYWYARLSLSNGH